MKRLVGRLAGGAALTACVATASVWLPAASTAPAWASASPQAQLAKVRQVTAPFHDLSKAEAAGYLPFLQCFDDPKAGGMGQHFLLSPALDGSVDLTNPPVLVYEPRGNRYKLVAVEYVVPGPPDMTPPQLLGQSFTYNSSLGVWKLHAWIWRPNPSGMFADYNPDVRMCPGH